MKTLKLNEIFTDYKMFGGIKKLGFFMLLMFCFSNVFSQMKPCHEYEADEKAQRENPDALKAKTELEAFTIQYMQNNMKSETTYIIPVVFHVLHNYGSENISKAQILDAIRIMNEDFNKLNPDTSAIIQAFQGIAANSHIEFRLAQLDPNGNCTDGIVRVATSYTYNADDNSKDQSPAWPRNKYLNVWTCNSIGSGAAGYSMYPSSVSGPWGAAVDGVMILSSYIGSIGTGSAMTSRALTHEVGHYLNLPHTWGNSNQPGLASNCSIDDGVADTPNTIGHTSCNLNANTCGVLDNVQNYMDYSYCSNMYTEGQKARMRAALNSSVSNRNNLRTAANLIATGTNDGYAAQVCAPVPDFTFDKYFGCDNLTVQYNPMISNVDSGYTLQWNFPGGSPSVSTDLNPIVVYSAPGFYNTSLTASNVSGSNNITKSDIIQVLDPTVGEGIPWTEGFESSSFPENTLDANKNWLIKGNGISGWSRSTSAAYSGSSCLLVANANNYAGQTSELYSPNIVFAGNSPVNLLTFKVAYAQKTSTDNDKLQVYFSNNCGQTWYLRLTRTGATLATNGGTPVSSFTPSDTTKWSKVSLVISSLFLTKPNFRVKFLATSGDGNSLFLDNINIGSSTATDVLPISVTNNINLYPNPVTNESVLSFDINHQSAVNIILSNILGQNIAAYRNKLNAGMYDFSLQEIVKTDLQKGIYFLNITINEKTHIIKLIKD